MQVTISAIRIGTTSRLTSVWSDHIPTGSVAVVTGQNERWSPVPRTRTYELIVDQVENQILAGTLKVGDRLPGERELAARLRVSRAAVREAMRTLEAQGVLRTGVGSGPDAGTVVSALPSQALTRLLRMHIALSNFSTHDVIEARVILERASASLAASHAPEESLAAMDHHVMMMAETEDRHRYNEVDTAFHIAIADAGGNRLFAAMTTAIREALQQPVLHRLEALDDAVWEAVRPELTSQHRAILEAIVAGDEHLAAELAEKHIRTARQLLASP